MTHTLLIPKKSIFGCLYGLSWDSTKKFYLGILPGANIEIPKANIF